MIKKFGIDISVWQKPSSINYDELAQNIDFAILRAGFTGYGTGESLYKDDAFDTHYMELHRRGIPIGAYWYSCANTKEEGIQEAKKCIEIVKDKTLLYPIFMDVEDNHHQRPTSKAILTDTVIAFCETIEQAGYYVGIYSSSSWFGTELDLERLAPYDLWVAQWSEREPSIRKGIWQFTSKGRLKGYNENLDCNYAYKDYPAIMKSAGLNGLNTSGNPPSNKPKPPSSKEKEKTHTYIVQSGDSLWRIAARLLGDGRRYSEIKKLNGLTSDIIYAGQKLKIPGATDTSSLKVGDTVKVTASRYATGEAVPQWVKEKTHKVSQIEKDKVLLGWPDGIASWLPIDGVRKI